MYGKFGKLNPMFGKIARHSKGNYYNNTWMRSSWEIKFAHFLDCSNIKWKYEFKTFDLGDMTYTPDFYLPEFNCYVEIKGWWRGKAKIKFDKFKQIYSNINIELFMKPELKELGVL